MDSHFLLAIALMLAFAKILGELCERYLKQPAVLAEILAGVVLGKSCLGWIDGNDKILQQVGEIGAVLLLFEVGLESDIYELFKVGKEAVWVALVGVILPFGGGFVCAQAFGCATLPAVFVGAALTATSVGITARVFSDLNSLQSIEARIVLGAAVADDVIGLIILATVSGLATSAFSWAVVERTSTLAIIFVIAAILVGLRATPFVLKWATSMKTRAAMPSAAVVLCLLTASLAEAVQLSPIVGSFAAGVVLAKSEEVVHFEDNVKSIADLFVPLFFVLMGARMDLSSLDRHTLGLAAAILVVAVIGKLAAGLSMPFKGANRWIVGLGMMPRGEVGLIFAGIGESKGIIGPSLFAAIVLVVTATTFMTPPLLSFVGSRRKEQKTAIS
jgi:Kef-type K+ transport system membrane component KefB